MQKVIIIVFLTVFSLLAIYFLAWACLISVIAWRLLSKLISFLIQDFFHFYGKLFEAIFELLAHLISNIFTPIILLKDFFALHFELVIFLFALFCVVMVLIINFS